MPQFVPWCKLSIIMMKVKRHLWDSMSFVLGLNSFVMKMLQRKNDIDHCHCSGRR